MISLTKALRRFRRRDELARLPVTVYTRQQCCCCHKAIDVLREASERYGFAIETVDVDGDPELVRRHGESVPVVEIGGKVRFRGVVNPALLDRLLHAEAAAARDRG
ncbi:MAG: glutaredoxin family protein [Isosphaeraceae bacterium]|nr:glutaredoxin family protein [Isosphaeraceae bacterium]